MTNSDTLDNKNFVTAATRNLTDEDDAINKDFQTESHFKKIKFVDPPNLDIFDQAPKEAMIDVYIHTKYTVTIKSLKMKHLVVVVTSKQDISRNLLKTMHRRAEQTY